jgi:hypothetical protein
MPIPASPKRPSQFVMQVHHNCTKLIFPGRMLHAGYGGSVSQMSSYIFLLVTHVGDHAMVVSRSHAPSSRQLHPQLQDFLGNEQLSNWSNIYCNAS